MNIASATELKQLLLEWLATGKNLDLDLEAVEEIDITIMQLLWSAGQEAARRGIGFGGRTSRAAAFAMRDAGLIMPGIAYSGAAG